VFNPETPVSQANVSIYGGSDRTASPTPSGVLQGPAFAIVLFCGDYSICFLDVRVPDSTEYQIPLEHLGRVPMKAIRVVAYRTVGQRRWMLAFHIAGERLLSEDSVLLDRSAKRQSMIAAPRYRLSPLLFQFLY
jgi:hypothetical protein